jgi:hypothetical protein
MLKLQKTRIVRSFHREILPGHDVKQEGVALCYVNDNGIGRVRPSIGAVGERFAGVSLSQVVVPEFLTRAEAVSADGTKITLDRQQVVVGQIRFVATNGTVMSLVSASPAKGEFTIDFAAGVITLNSADAGITGTIFYKYIPTVIEAIAAQGAGPIGGITGAQYVSTVGVIYEGDVSTDQFDVSCDWTKATNIYVGNGGQFTCVAPVDANTGELQAPIAGCNLIEAPGIVNPFLTINFGSH